MKPYLTLDETKSILDLVKSNDGETQLLGLNILVSKSFKTNVPCLRTAIYNAQNMLRKIKLGGKFYSHQIDQYYISLVDALDRYMYKLGHAGN